MTTSLQLAPHPRAQLTPLERLEALCDPGSLQLLRTGVRSSALGDRAVDGDGVLTGAGTVKGRPVFCYAEDGAFLGGSLGQQHASSIARTLRLAATARAPVVGFVHSAGARLQEGVDALGGYGDIFNAMVALSGVVPQICVVTGTSAGGGAYAPALADFLIMTKDAQMFLTGPGVVREALGEEVDAASLGGSAVHSSNGVAHLVADDDDDAARAARDLLGFLPQYAGGERAISGTLPAEPPGVDIGALVPREHRKVYDVRDVIAGLADRGRFVEICPSWARNVVCGFGRIEGRPVGVVANQPKYLGGVLNADASQKAARFVRTCHLYGVPLVALVDTPGFLPGTRQEQAGVIRHGAKLVHAFAEAAVPKVTVVLRKSFGGAHIAMNSQQLGAHFTFAWPDAQIGVMAATQAVALIHRREIAAAADPGAQRALLADRYEAEQLSAAEAARRGQIDEIIAPHETRERLAWAMRTLAGTDRRPRPAGNVPL